MLMRPLFDLDDAAVTAIRDGIVLFANPAAQKILRLHDGDRADAVYPAELLDDPADRFTAACRIGGVSMNVTVTRSAGVTLIRALPRDMDDQTFRSLERALSQLGSDLATAHRAMDAIAAADTAEDVRRDRLHMLYRSFYRMRRLHSHLTLAERIEGGELTCRTKPTDMILLCGELCDSVEASVRPLGYSIRFEAPGAPCYVMADGELIETMLLNLITNSLLHISHGEVLIRLQTHGDRCVIAVNDAGSGMDEATLAGAVSGSGSPSLTDIKAGAGLGLFVARGIAEAHGGSLILDSREGVGTSVRISLPRMESNGIAFLSHPDNIPHLNGMNPILTELSVFLDRSFYGDTMMD